MGPSDKWSTGIDLLFVKKWAVDRVALMKLNDFRGTVDGSMFRI